MKTTFCNIRRSINTRLQPGEKMPLNQGNGFNRFRPMFAAAILFALGFLAPSSHAGSTYTAHEWGTFTSVQGANGDLLSWRPLQSSELPAFVFSTTTSNGFNPSLISKVSM